MLTRIGIGSLLAGLFVGIFGGISNLMENDSIWVDLTLSKLMGEERTESIITGTEIVALQDAMDVFFYEIPLAVLIFGMGVLLLLIGLFVKDH